MSHDTLPNYEPDEFVSGETLEWRKSLADFNASDGWALTYYFRGYMAGFNAPATADGNSWKVTVTVPGYSGSPTRVDWEAWVSKGDESYRVDGGSATLTRSLKSVPLNEVFDARTQAEKDLDAVRAALVPSTSAGVQEYEIGGVGTNRRVRYFDKAALLALETSLAQRVNRERRAAAHKRGAPYFKTIHSR